jgi:hypothetical protein
VNRFPLSGQAYNTTLYMIMYDYTCEDL